jgi:predicted MPP superfamily phosphohydrolase
VNLTILHISDLHRDPANPVSNVSLLDSLERDRDRYSQESPPIGSTDLIIVSGDIIHGISPDVSNPMEQLAQQYQQAEDFLIQLAGSFVNGDRNRVIIVPGNRENHALL